LESNPLDGHLYLFCNKRRNRLKVLYWDGSGLWICNKRLEKGRYSWPELEESASQITLAHEELSLLLGGIELERTRRKNWWRRSAWIAVKKVRSPNNFFEQDVLDCIQLSTPPMQDTLDQLPPELRERFVPFFQDRQRLIIENRLLREEIRLLRIAKYGPRSEKLSDAQLELLEGEPGVNRAEVETEIAQAEKDQAQTTPKPRPRHPGRQEFPAHLERREIKIPCLPEDCVCPQCQGEKAIIGYERSQELGVIPAQYFVKVTLREKRACPLHPEEGVVCASLPSKIIPRSKLSDEMIVDVLVKKYGDHLPAYRQSMILERDAGLEMSRKTLIGLIMRSGGWLEALMPGLKSDLFNS